MRAYFFGCTNRINGTRDVGHYLYGPGLHSVRGDRQGFPFPWARLDGGFVKIGNVEGVATLVHPADGWTYVDIVDSSGDSRGNSHSGFLFDADLSYDDALAAARQHFPEVFGRMERRFTIRSVQDAPVPPQSSYAQPRAGRANQTDGQTIREGASDAGT